MENGELHPDSPSRDELLAENARLRMRLAAEGPGDFGFPILDRVSDAVVIVDLEMRITYLNPAAALEYGVTSAEVLGRPLDEMFLCHWPEPGGEQASHDAVRKHGHWRGLNSHTKRDGSVVQVESTVSVLPGLDGNPAAVLAAIRDITTRCATEDALRDSERRFREMIDSLPVAVYTIDADGWLTHFNPACVEFSGRIPQPGQDRWCVSHSIYRPDGSPLPETHHPMEAVLRGEPVERGLEGIVGRPDGSRGWFAAYPAAIRDASGTIVGVINALLDITERKQSENVLAAQSAALLAADHRKDEFLAMLAHELRNPLAPMRNAIEILRSEHSTPDESHLAEDLIARQIGNLSRMIDDLLDVSRISEGRVALHRQPVSLQEILTASADAARQACISLGQNLSVSLPDAPLMVNADATRLEQVFGNLLANANKYSGRGTRISITASATSAAEAIIRVADNGIGINPELLPRIFDLFVQSSRSLDRAHGGLGIGLTIVQRLVTLHGGTITAQSGGSGKGTEFTIHLPLLSTPAGPPPAPPTRSSARSHRILIVDDNEDAAETMAMLQNLRGHQAKIAYNGPAALDLAASFLPRVILLDIGLPGMDGYEVASRIRATPALQDAFIVAITGYGSGNDRERCRSAGFDEHLTKPADLEILRGWLDVLP